MDIIFAEFRVLGNKSFYTATSREDKTPLESD